MDVFNWCDIFHCLNDVSRTMDQCFLDWFLMELRHCGIYSAIEKMNEF